MPEYHYSTLYRELEKISHEPGSLIRSLDLHLGNLLAQCCQHSRDEVLLATVLVSAAVTQGHVCLPLKRMHELVPSLPETYQSLMLHGEYALSSSPMVAAEDTNAALILDAHQRLYLKRYYRYETDIASALKQRFETLVEPDYPLARKTLQRLASYGHLNSGQQHAAALALIKPLLVVSGGPGTGKTYSVAYTLALIQALAPHPLRIALAAPTGKAAARLKASIARAKDGMAKDSMLMEYSKAIPDDAQTLHRLLGLRPGADDFIYNQANPLNTDLLVIDEASMIDLVMMDGLLHAIPPDCRLILMGDHHQLPSVSAGNIFSDLCAEGVVSHTEATLEKLRKLFDLPTSISIQQSNRVQDAFTMLNINHRQAGADGLPAFAEAINSGSIAKVIELLATKPTAIDMPYFYLKAKDRQVWLQTEIRTIFDQILNAPSLEQAFEKMEAVRFLCAVREGPMGIEGINQLAEQLLINQKQVSTEPNHYRGKPIIIRHNQYSLRLFNGDSGLLWEDQDGQLKAWFRKHDGGFFPIAIARLPAHDTAFAITVHQAQGSEFKKVLLLLPEEESRVLSRELVYTGVTRAREALSLCCDKQTLSNAISARTVRYSGLGDRLRD